MLEAQGLHKIYTGDRGPVPAVTDLSPRLLPGEFLAVCGRSGSGKSTLLAMLAGLSRPTRGKVLLGEVDLWGLTPDALADFRNRRIGFIFQFAGLLPTLRAIDNVAFPALIPPGVDLADTYARAESLLRQVGLLDRRNAYPSELSGGEQRRVALARTLINQPPVLLADEPTSDLDEETEGEVLDLLQELHAAHHTALLIVTHSPVIANRADRIVTLRRGRLEETRLPAQEPVRQLATGKDRNGENGLVRASGSPSSMHTPPAALGAGLGSFIYGLTAWTALVVVGILMLNQAVSFFQRRALAEHRSARQRLEEVALQQVRADIDGLAYGPDGGYVLTLYVQNLDSERELFVLAPSVQVHVQVGRGWEEVPSRCLDGQEGRVVRLTDRHRFQYAFRADLRQFEEQVAGYMHVRVSCGMLLSQQPQPRDDLYERGDAYYVYLKPQSADDAEILRKNGWSGKPPVWIPMPPH